MLHQLRDGSEHSPSKHVGHTIAGAKLEEDRLSLAFDNGKGIEIFDNGQSCCEYRYMRTDDDVSSLVGHKLLAIEATDAPDEPGEYGYHEVVFLEIRTDGGFITIANHNEHNGYYGGFGLAIREFILAP
jgi:hypothetical protein